VKQGAEVVIVSGKYADLRGRIHRSWGFHSWVRLHDECRGDLPKLVRSDNIEIRVADVVTRLGRLAS
jgi:hypothetical protein